jgi:hypothetical protein
LEKLDLTMPSDMGRAAVIAFAKNQELVRRAVPAKPWHPGHRP